MDEEVLHRNPFSSCTAPQVNALRTARHQHPLNPNQQPQQRASRATLVAHSSSTTSCRRRCTAAAAAPVLLAAAVASAYEPIADSKLPSPKSPVKPEPTLSSRKLLQQQAAKTMSGNTMTNTNKPNVLWGGYVITPPYWCVSPAAAVCPTVHATFASEIANCSVELVPIQVAVQQLVQCSSPSSQERGQ